MDSSRVTTIFTGRKVLRASRAARQATWPSSSSLPPKLPPSTCCTTRTLPRWRPRQSAIQWRVKKGLTQEAYTVISVAPVSGTATTASGSM